MATYNSNLIIAGGGQATPSVVPGTPRPVYGSIAIASNTSFATTDTLPLFFISAPSAAHIVAFWFNSPALNSGGTLTMSLIDSLATPTTIINATTAFQGGGWVTHTNAVNGTIGAGVSYVASNLLFLKPAAASNATTGASALSITFMFEFAMD